MDRLLASLRAAAEPTRLRLLALAGRGAFCVSEFTEILGQSQPRLSRHLKLLCDCGLLDRGREGANVWFALPPGEPGALSRDLVARLPETDPILEADRRQAARVLAERARVASESFRMMRTAALSTALILGGLLRRFGAVLFGIGTIREKAQCSLMQPARCSDSFRPLAGSGEIGRPINSRLGLDAVGLVAYPDSHAGVVEGLHPGINLAVVELFQDAL